MSIKSDARNLEIQSVDRISKKLAEFGEETFC